MSFRLVLLAALLVLMGAIGFAMYNLTVPVTVPPTPPSPQPASPVAATPIAIPVMAPVLAAPPPAAPAPAPPSVAVQAPAPLPVAPAPAPPPATPTALPDEGPEPSGPVHGLDARGLNAAVMPHIQQVKECWEEWHRGNPMVQPDFDVTMRIKSTGKGRASLSRVQVANQPEGHEQMERCMMNALKSGRFEAPKLGDYQATYPVRLPR